MDSNQDFYQKINSLNNSKYRESSLIKDVIVSIFSLIQTHRGLTSLNSSYKSAKEIYNNDPTQINKNQIEKIRNDITDQNIILMSTYITPVTDKPKK